MGVRNFFHEQRQYFCVAIHTCPRMQVTTSVELSDWMSARFESFRESLELDHFNK